MKKESKKKGCLPGCLFVLVIIIVLAAVLAVFGYLNRHRILPFVTDKLGVQVSSVIQYAGGTKAKTGMPSRFLDNAYKIDLPQGEKTIKVTTSDAPADQTYESFIQYFREKGWEVRKEMEALEVASKQLKSVPENLEEEVRVAQLSRDGRRMNLGVTRYNNETVAAVWYTTGPDSETAEPEPARSESEKSEKIDASKNLPEEISGSDPEDVPLYPDSIRTSYQKVTEGDKISHLASYGAEADKGKVFNFYEEQLKNKNWEIVKKAETEGKKYLEAARDQDKVRIIIQKSNDYTDYTEIEIAAVYRSKQ